MNPHQWSMVIPYFPRKLFFFEFLGCRKFHIVSAIIFLLCNQNLNSFLTWLQKQFKGGNYSREETICGNTVSRVFELLSESLDRDQRIHCLNIVKSTIS